ncbi:hypothetical protein MYMAC_004391 [Corallococcus macrosporus DSM 14697]|uniref:Uncharacterized protein n=2 Tax=Corallococcus macrosporus TaxID=35 RepID=A0A250JYP4_9BACT|nr:hypothetical protein MYMAC_004391 [Corallococcus macrosporus DSM 14697]
MLGHDGLGQGLVPTIRSIAHHTKRPVLHVQHLATKAWMHFADENAMDHPLAVRKTLRLPLTKDGPWFAWSIREISPRKTRIHKKAS